MLAYVASRPRFGERRSSPNTMLIIISAHIAALALIMSAKMDLPTHVKYPPILVDLIHDPTPPPKNATKPQPTQQPTRTTIYTPPTEVPTTKPDEQQPTTAPSLPDPGNGPTVFTPPQQPIDLTATPVPVSTPAQPITAVSDLKPPYPESKLLAGEEATLTLRLTVDERGRVVAVDPVGRADPVFVSAARRHLLARWRYKPAMEGGRAVATTVVVTLRFQLDD